ncbi:hypothetical protein ACOSQ2_019232 [Xanthoceras sorbifolium]
MIFNSLYMTLSGIGPFLENILKQRFSVLNGRLHFSFSRVNCSLPSVIGSLNGSKKEAGAHAGVVALIEHFCYLCDLMKNEDIMGNYRRLINALI